MTLQEYLVKLGFNVDSPSLNKFLGVVSQVSAETAQLGSTAIETATAIEVMVARVARQYESLYYVSQRTGQSVRFIQSTQFAFRQIGLSADDATQSIEAIGSTLRTQPWLRYIFGGETTPQGIANRLAQSGLPYFLQARFAEMIGMDEKTLFHLQRFAKVEADAQREFVEHQRAAGIDPKTLGLQFTAFGRALNLLETDLDIFGDRMAMDFLGPVQTGVGLLDRIVQWLNRVDAATSGWAGTLETLAGTAAGLWAVEKVLRRILGLSAATATGRALGLGGRSLALGLRGGWVGAAAAVMGLIATDDPETKKKLRSSLGPLFYELGLSTTPDLNAAAGGAGSHRNLQGAMDRFAQAEDFFKAHGFSPEAARGIASALFFESGKTLSPTAFNPAGGGRGAVGIGQWRGARAEKFRGLFGHDLKDATFQEQLQYVLWELTQGSDKGALQAGNLLKGRNLTSGQAAGTFIDLFERPGAGGNREVTDASAFADALSRLAAQQQGGAPNVTINQKTDIHLNGTGDAANKAVIGAQGDVNDNLVRNVVGVVR